jgi:spore cortex biosynthesis protein YabQ
MYFIDVSAQSLTFLLSILLGAVMCLCYDLIRAMHKAFLKGFLEILITDILFWLIWGFVTFSFLIINCGGEIRLYVLVGICIGFITVRMLLSKYILKLFNLCFSIIYKIFHFLSAVLCRIFVPLNKYLKKIALNTKKVLQERFNLLYNHVNTKNK